MVLPETRRNPSVGYNHDRSATVRVPGLSNGLAGGRALEFDPFDEAVIAVPGIDGDDMNVIFEAGGF